MADAIDATASVIKLIGDVAQAAVNVGDVVLPSLNTTLEVMRIFGVVFPPAAIAANDIAIALPIIEKVAKYSPKIATGLEDHKGMIKAAINVGAVAFQPLQDLLNTFPSLAQHSPFFQTIDDVIKNSEFSPQDPRFYRNNPLDY